MFIGGNKTIDKYRYISVDQLNFIKKHQVNCTRFYIR